MSTLVVNQKHEIDHLALYVQDEGILRDAFSVEFAVHDDSAGYPGTVVLPAAGSGRVDATTVGKFGTGFYGVIDPGAANQPWTPPTSISRGRVIWYYTLEDGGAEVVVERTFEVVDASYLARPQQTIVLMDQVIGDPLVAALLTAGDLTHRKVLKMLRRWTQTVHKFLRQPLFPTREVRRLRWRRYKTLFLDQVLYGLESLTLVSTGEVESNDDLLVLGCEGLDRKNPKIEYRSAETEDIFSLSFYRRYENRLGSPRRDYASVAGVWGYIDHATLGPPADVVDVSLEVLTQMISGAQKQAPGGPKRRERVDGHETEWGVLVIPHSTAMLATLKTREMREILGSYRSPMPMSMTGA